MSKRKEPEHSNGDIQNGKRQHIEHEKSETCQTSPTPSSTSTMSQVANRAAVTKPAPEFKQVDALLPTGEFGKLSLSDFHGKWLVLFFYPLDFTFVCPTEIIDFSERAEEFRKLGAEVVGASIDSKFSHLAWTQQPRNKGGLGPMKIPLLADVDRSLSRDYGVLMDAGFTLRGLFIIDPKGEVKHATLNHPDVGRNVDEVLRVLQAYQYAAVHGEVCPSGWKPGQGGMKPDPKGSQAYFQAAHK